MYDRRPASFPAPRAESSSVPTNVAQAIMPASAHAPSPSSTIVARAYAAAAVSHDAIDATTSVANSTARVRRGAHGQIQRGTEMTSASETRRSSGSSTAPAGRTTTDAPWPARARSARAMSAYVDRPRSARPANRASSAAVAARAKVASSPAAAATTTSGSTAVSTPRAAVVIGVASSVLIGAGGAAFDSVAVVTATERTVGEDPKPAGVPPGQ